MGARSLSKWRIVESARGEKISGGEYNEREGGSEREARKKKETGRSRCVSVHSPIGTRFRAVSCLVLIVVEVAVVMLVVVIVSTGSGPPPTLDSPLSLSLIRSSSLRLSSTRQAHSSLLRPFVSPFRLAFFVSPAPFLSSALTARPSFLPASPFHRSVLMLFLRPPLSFSLSLPTSLPPSLHSHLILPFVLFHFAISARTHIELGWLRRQPLTTVVLVQLLSTEPLNS